VPGNWGLVDLGSVRSVQERGACLVLMLWPSVSLCIVVGSLSGGDWGIERESVENCENVSGNANAGGNVDVNVGGNANANDCGNANANGCGNDCGNANGYGNVNANDGGNANANDGGNANWKDCGNASVNDGVNVSYLVGRSVLFPLSVPNQMTGSHNVNRQMTYGQNLLTCF